ncbi:cytochrome o ubiquinol oxidase subunit IV [Sodalis-like secondary symbiont of Drepanosiphum platanoidis]|uniref:cytochrome o ubiquinol oxidase subunit IV n=1 Tax=Sodalis-like secondary symbiont of Drepanosiphum platanoidis TaxID=2994493 RepID=UPI003463B24D
MSFLIKKKINILHIILSSILILIPFFFNKSKIFTKNEMIFIILLCLSLYIIMHSIFFFKLTYKKNKILNLIFFIFSILIFIILITGSVWIMYHLHDNLINYEIK